MNTGLTSDLFAIGLGYPIRTPICRTILYFIFCGRRITARLQEAPCCSYPGPLISTRITQSSAPSPSQCSVEKFPQWKKHRPCFIPCTLPRGPGRGIAASKELRAGRGPSKWNGNWVYSQAHVVFTRTAAQRSRASGVTCHRAVKGDADLHPPAP